MIKYFLYTFIGNKMYKPTFKISDLMRIFTSLQLLKDDNYGSTSIKETASQVRNIQTLLESPLQKKDREMEQEIKNQYFILKRTKPFK